jgi:hypothetical protein
MTIHTKCERCQKPTMIAATSGTAAAIFDAVPVIGGAWNRGRDGLMHRRTTISKAIRHGFDLHHCDYEERKTEALRDG